MGFVKEDVKIVGDKKNKKLLALFDSGAGRNYIRRKFKEGGSVDDVGYFVFKRDFSPVLADGSKAKGEIVRFKEIRIRDFSVNNPEFVIMDNLIEDVIIGVFFMQNLGISLDPPNEKIEIRNVK